MAGIFFAHVASKIPQRGIVQRHVRDSLFPQQGFIFMPSTIQVFQHVVNPLARGINDAGTFHGIAFHLLFGVLSFGTEPRRY